MIVYEPDSGDGTAGPLPPALGAIDVEHRFDAAAAWAALPAEHQAAIGAMTLALQAAWACEDAAEEAGGVMLQAPLHRAASHAEQEAIDALVRLFDTAVPRAAALTPAGVPRLPDTIGMVCRRCGCSEDDACDGGCGWTAPGLCTACVDVGEAARHG